MRAREVHQQRMLEALKLRAQGKSYDEIAQRLGYKDRSGAYRAVKGILRRHQMEGAAEFRALQLRRLEALLSAVWEQAMQGSVQHVDRALAIMSKMDEVAGIGKTEATALAVAPLGVVEGERVLPLVQYITRQMEESTA